jgi:RNA polymerase sigma-70 factor (ECF subfamily)
MHQSFNILVAEYRPMIVVYLRSLGADAHLAEDLAQEAFLTAYQSLDSFDEGGNFGSWMRGIARNKALMHWRAAAARPPLSADPRSVEGIDEVFEAMDRQSEEGDWWAERREIMKECIRQLSSHLQRAIERVYTEGETLDEAAATLGATRLAIGQRLSRARNQIRKCVTLKLNSSRNHD